MSIEAPSVAIGAAVSASVGGAESMGFAALTAPSAAIESAAPGIAAPSLSSIEAASGGSFRPGFSLSELNSLPELTVSAANFNPDKVVPPGVTMALLQNEKIFAVIRPSTIAEPEIENIVSGNVAKEVSVSLISDETTITPIYGPHREEATPTPVDQITQRISESVKSEDQKLREPESLAPGPTVAENQMVEVDPRQNSSEDQPRFSGETPNEDLAADVALAVKEMKKIEQSDMPAEQQALWIAKLKRATLTKHEADAHTEKDTDTLAQIEALTNVREVVMPDLSIAPATSVESLVDELAEAEVQATTINSTATATESGDKTPPPTRNTTENEDVEKKQKPKDEPQWEIKKAANHWKDARKILEERLKKVAQMFHGLTGRGSDPKDYLNAHLIELDVPGIEESVRIIAGKLRLPMVAAEANVAIEFVEPENVARMEKAVEHVIWKNKPEEDKEEMQPEGIVVESRLPDGARQLAAEGAISVAFKEKPKMWLPVKKQAPVDPIQLNKLERKAA